MFYFWAHFVYQLKFWINFIFRQLCLSKILNFPSFPVGLLLDQTGSGSCPGHPWRYLPTNPVNATRQITGLVAARVLPEGRRCIYVRVHNVRNLFWDCPTFVSLLLRHSSFVFMALIEYLAVNIVLGDSPEPNEKPAAFPERSKMEKLYDLTVRSRRSMSSTVRKSQCQCGGEKSSLITEQSSALVPFLPEWKTRPKGQRGYRSCHPGLCPTDRECTAADCAPATHIDYTWSTETAHRCPDSAAKGHQCGQGVPSVLSAALYGVELYILVHVLWVPVRWEGVCGSVREGDDE